MYIQSQKKGFTLIELLIVIAIIAVLAVAVILTLNPAELLRQSRDSTRLSDMSTLKSAIGLFQADVTGGALATTTPTYVNPYTHCYTSLPTGTVGGPATCALFNTSFSNPGYPTTANQRKVDGTGWLPVKLNDISSGSPIGNLPVDPTNSTTYYYAYAATATSSYKLMAKMESNKYTVTDDIGDDDKDGGTNDDWYETGTNLSL